MMKRGAMTFSQLMNLRSGNKYYCAGLKENGALVHMLLAKEGIKYNATSLSLGMFHCITCNEDMSFHLNEANDGQPIFSNYWHAYAFALRGRSEKAKKP